MWILHCTLLHPAVLNELFTKHFLRAEDCVVEARQWRQNRKDPRDGLPVKMEGYHQQALQGPNTFAVVEASPSDGEEKVAETLFIIITQCTSMYVGTNSYCIIL